MAELTLQQNPMQGRKSKQALTSGGSCPPEPPDTTPKFCAGLTERAAGGVILLRSGGASRPRHQPAVPCRGRGAVAVVPAAPTDREISTRITDDGRQIPFADQILHSTAFPPDEINNPMAPKVSSLEPWSQSAIKRRWVSTTSSDWSLLLSLGVGR